MPQQILATYRLQFRPGFGFDEAAVLAPYLAALGVSHVYASPYLQAAPGSTHGYDVVDHRRVNDELGGPEAHARMVQALKEHGLGQVLDIVPNHMAVGGPENAWWWDVLENGPSSRYASYFDVDWDPPEARLRNTVLLPVLGDHYGRVLESGELRVHRDGARFTVRYFDHRFPVGPRTMDTLLATAAQRCGSDDLGFIADTFARLPLPTNRDIDIAARRHRDKEVLLGLLARLCDEQPPVAGAIDTVLGEVNASPDALDELLERQNYRLAYWRTAGHELGYRRFFDINSLAGLRVEDERVFQDTHALVLSWLAEGTVDGVRIDHIDGLREPETYLRRLFSAVPGGWIVVEKILEGDEKLRDSWPVAGTTGYEFLNRAGGLFVDPAGEAALTSIYEEFTGESVDYHALVREKKRLVLRESLGSDLNRLTAQLLEICERHRRHRDYTRHDLHEALREVIVAFPVYRTYVHAYKGWVSDEDRQYVNQAVAEAKATRPDIDERLFDFLQDILLLQVEGEMEHDFLMRFQQFTGPAMAKGVEDTAFYHYHRLTSLNEVGGDPSRFGITVKAFHEACADVQAHWPSTMLTTSTHDTKRSEDVRARISLLSEVPREWGAAVHRWAAMNERFRTGELPDRNTEYLLYQTLVGAWPLPVQRALAYMEKATREAKAHTSWTSPDAAYETALRSFIESILGDDEFTADLEGFVQPLIAAGRVSSLAQTLIKLTAPGVPDIYQGTELWDLSLVDPDNRRPVDFATRQRLLTELACATPERVLASTDQGLPKLWVIRQALALRRRLPDAFGGGGSYRPLTARGPCTGHMVAFARGGQAVMVAPRLVLGLNPAWPDTTLTLPRGHWRNELTGETVAGGKAALADLLARFPVALLARE
jgi:(1->4)-alpha-D-glucan 1-alpha-D-glucosylmutase